MKRTDNQQNLKVTVTLLVTGLFIFVYILGMALGLFRSTKSNNFIVFWQNHWRPLFWVIFVSSILMWLLVVFIYWASFGEYQRVKGNKLKSSALVTGLIMVAGFIFYTYILAYNLPKIVTALANGPPVYSYKQCRVVYDDQYVSYSGTEPNLNEMFDPTDKNAPILTLSYNQTRQLPLIISARNGPGSLSRSQPVINGWSGVIYECTQEVTVTYIPVREIALEIK